MSADDAYFEAISNAVLGKSDTGVNALLGNAAPRMEAHRGNYQMSVQSALRSGYPVIERLVGEEYMQGLAQAYVAAHPPIQATLTVYGDKFASFLRTFAPVQKQLPWLSAVAELDHAWFKAYEAADETALTPGDLASVSPTKLPILAPGLVASAQILRFLVPAYSIWRTNKQDAEIISVDLKKGAEWAVVWRQDNQVRHVSLDQAEYGFLLNVQAGQSLALAYAESSKFDKQFDLQQQFSRWLSAGIFKGSTK